MSILNVKLSFCYWLFAFVAPLIIRVITSAFVAWRLSKGAPRETWLTRKFWSGQWFDVFKGWDTRDEIPADYWLPYFIGVLEMLAYPLLIWNNEPAVIGAWLALKTADRLRYADQEKRGLYNRYLLANALILAASCVSASWLLA